MSDNNADYNGSGQDEYFATNDSTQADYRQSQDGYNQPASQPHNPNPYASQQPVQGYAPGTQGNNIPGGTYAERDEQCPQLDEFFAGDARAGNGGAEF